MGSEAEDAAREEVARERPTPGIADAFRELGETGRATYEAGREAAHAFHILLKADIALARSAFGRVIAFTAVAIAFGASAWLLVVAATVAWLVGTAQWSWTAALLAAAGASFVITGVAIYISLRYFEYTRFKATRRQLARLGIGELSDLMPDAGSGKSAQEAAEELADAAADNGKLKKGLGVDVTPP